MSAEQRAKLLADLKQSIENRQSSYREMALKLFPWICARCGKEFTGQTLSGLTVHHKDQDHRNNPPTGVNWELLCIACHDREHATYAESQWSDDAQSDAEHDSRPINNPFANLGALLKNKG